MLPDLNAAFDTVDQTKLLSILNQEIGIEGKALMVYFIHYKKNTKSKN